MTTDTFRQHEQACPAADSGIEHETNTLTSIHWDQQKLRTSEHSLGNKAARVLWQLVYLVLFRPTPRVLHGWRCWLLRVFGAKVGKKVRVHPSIKVWAPWNLELDDYSCIGDAVDCYSVGKLIVGRYATVSQYSVLCTATHDHGFLHCPLVVGRIEIEPYAWVCAQAFVMPNVTVETGTVIGARSVVTRNVGSWKVAAGNPCRVIKERELKTERDDP